MNTKKCKVVMLATKDEEALLGFLMEKLVTKGYLNAQKKQHLYILSDDEIKEGDWFWKPDCNMVFQAEYTPHKGCKKVIASTDTNLLKPGAGAFNSKACLPQLSKQFIKQYVEAYNNGNPIEEVEVEYAHSKDTLDKVSSMKMNNKNEIELLEFCQKELKINSDNTINIKLVKDTWTREEVITLCMKAYHQATKDGDKAWLGTFDKWIEKNL